MKNVIVVLILIFISLITFSCEKSNVDEETNKIEYQSSEKDDTTSPGEGSGGSGEGIY